jgi:hypothetical protein
MTNEEKRMNKYDLNHYKINTNDELKALIPGIHNLNTVGSSPLKRGANQIMNSNKQLMPNESIMLKGSQSSRVLPIVDH